jgi:hypothetical protein
MHLQNSVYPQVKQSKLLVSHEGIPADLVVWWNPAFLLDYIKRCRDGSVREDNKGLEFSTLWSMASHLKLYFRSHTGLHLSEVCPDLDDWLKRNSKQHTPKKASTFCP